MIICTEYTQAGRLVSTMGIDPLAYTHTYVTYALKDTYKEQFDAGRCIENTCSKPTLFYLTKI